MAPQSDGSAARDPSSGAGEGVVQSLVPHLLHRLGNQLTAVEGLLDLLVDRGEAGVELRTAQGEAARAVRLVLQAGHLTRSRRGRAELLDLPALLGDLQPLFEEVAHAGSARCAPVEQGGAHPTLVEADPRAAGLLALALAFEAVAGLPSGGGLSLRVTGGADRVALVARATAPGDAAPSTRLASEEVAGRSAALAGELGWSLRRRAGDRWRLLAAFAPAAR